MKMIQDFGPPCKMDAVASSPGKGGVVFSAGLYAGRSSRVQHRERQVRPAEGFP